MRSKFCFVSTLILLARLSLDASALSREELQVTNSNDRILSQEQKDVKKIASLSLKEDPKGRKSIRGFSLEVPESEELKQLRLFEQRVLEQEQELQGTSKQNLKQISFENPSVDRSLLRKMLQIKNLPPGYVRFEDRIIKYIDFYQNDPKGRNILSCWLKRQGKYRPMIETVLKQHKLPEFLLYVAMIESGYNPHDRSNKGAVGLWQFMPEGARIYGLRVDYWVDERKDPKKSTEAVARYFEDLHKRFGSWHLALAAFNAGYGAILRSVQKYNTNDYWKLALYENGMPQETRLYVPKAIATAVVGENLDLFGYPELKQDASLEFDEIELHQSLSLTRIAKALHISEEELRSLNPHLRRHRVPPLIKGESFTLYIPPTKANKVRLAEQLEKEEEYLQTYVVPFGKRPEDIATEFGISRSTLWQLNEIEDRSEVRAGLTLFLPGKYKPTTVKSTNKEELSVVAVPDKDFVVPGRKQVFYRVIYGDTASGIAQFFKVKLNDLALWNNLDLDATLATNMILSVWVKPDFDTKGSVLVDPSKVLLVTVGSEEFLDATEALRGRKRILHSYQEGETLDSIAKQYHLTVADIERINRISRQTPLKSGQSIVVYKKLSPEEQKQAITQILSTHLKEQAQVAQNESTSDESVSLHPSEEKISQIKLEASPSTKEAASAENAAIKESQSSGIAYELEGPLQDKPDQEKQG